MYAILTSVLLEIVLLEDRFRDLKIVLDEDRLGFGLQLGGVPNNNL